MGSISGNTRKTKEKIWKTKKKHTHTKRGNDSCSWRERAREREGERGEWKSWWCASLTAVSGRSTCALKRRHRADDDDDDDGATTNRARQPITNRIRTRIKIRIEVAIGIYRYLCLCLILSGSWATCPKRTRSSFNREFDKDENIIIMWIAEWIPSECVCADFECWVLNGVCQKDWGVAQEQATDSRKCCWISIKKTKLVPHLRITMEGTERKGLQFNAITRQ